MYMCISYLGILKVSVFTMNGLQVLAAFCAVLTVYAICNNTAGCSLWQYRPRANSSCVCGKDWNRAVLCSSNHSLLLRVNYALGTFRNNKSGDEVIVAGVSKFAYIDPKDIFKPLRVYYTPNITTTEMAERVCRPNNRKGFLCEFCISGHGPSPYNSKCPKCNLSLDKAIALYLISRIVPIAVLFFLIMTFRIDLIRGSMLGYMFYCQVHVIFVRQLAVDYTLLQNSFLESVLNVFFYVSSVWNLDFLQITHAIPPFCISPRLNDYDILILNCISFIIPLCLVAFTYIFVNLHERNVKIIVLCWKPFHPFFVRIRRNWNSRDSIIHSYSSLYIISFPMLNYNTLLILRSTDLLGVCRIIKENVLIHHPSVHLYDRRYFYYPIIVLVLHFCLGVLPSLLLLLFPIRLFRMILQRCLPQSVYIKVNTFVQTFQSPFKDGSNGTCDFRYIPGFIASLMIFLTMLSALENDTPYSNYLLPSLPPSFAVASVLCAYTRPCKSSIGNLSLTFHLIWMAGIAVILTLWSHTPDLDTAVLMVLLGITIPAPHILMTIWALYQFEKKVCHLRQRCVVCFTSVMGQRWFAKRLDTSLLPDRLINSREYRELT